MTASARLTDCFADAPVLPSARARDLGPTLVVAPHPDDEVLGCGGVIALLRRAGLPVRVIIASDGAASHPGSTTYSPRRLAALRRAESEAGLVISGVTPGNVTFLGLPDGAVSRTDDPAGASAVDLARTAILSWSGFETVLLPWRRDPHGDHQATWALFTSALEQVRSSARRLEYPIWSRVHPKRHEVPQRGEAGIWRLDISPVEASKRASIMAHRSQTTGMIDDAEFGQCLTSGVLERFFERWEPFIEVIAAARAPGTEVP